MNDLFTFFEKNTLRNIYYRSIVTDRLKIRMASWYFYLLSFFFNFNAMHNIDWKISKRLVLIQEKNDTIFICYRFRDHVILKIAIDVFHILDFKQYLNALSYKILSLVSCFSMNLDLLLSLTAQLNKSIFM